MCYGVRTCVQGDYKLSGFKVGSPVFQSVSQTLHTCTASLFRPLLIYHITSSTTSERTHTLIRRSLTAFIHHVKSADQFSPVAEILISQFDLTLRWYSDASSVSQTTVPVHEQLRRVLEVIAVPCSVRQGSRLSRKQYRHLFVLNCIKTLHRFQLRAIVYIPFPTSI